MCLQKVSHITCQFLTATPIYSFDWMHDKNKIGCGLHHNKQHKLWSEECQNDIIKETVQHQTTKQYPVSASYQKAFLKALIRQVESSGQDPCEELCSIYMEFLNAVSQKTSFKSYYLPKKNIFVTLEENTNLLSNGTTGLVTWKGSLIMSEWLISNPQLLKGKRIIELGCGSGLTGLVSLKVTEVAHYTFTDSHQDVLNQVKKNVAINNINKDRYNIQCLNWGEDLESILSNFDILLAADVVFDPKYVPLLVETISKILNLKPGCIAYIASTVRNKETFQYFLDQIALNGLSMQHLDIKETNQVFIFDRSGDFQLTKIYAL